MRILAILLIGVAAMAAGCRFHGQPVVPPEKLTPSQRNFEAVWQASRQVLREHYFDLDRQDRRAGIVTTTAMTGKVAGEFWRRDAATGSDLAESTIQTIYRQAKVTIEPTGSQKQDFQAVVEVRAFRSNDQEIQVSSVSDAYDLFKLPGSRGRKRKLLDYGQDYKAKATTDLGRDSALENRITADIRSAASALRGKI